MRSKRNRRKLPNNKLVVPKISEPDAGESDRAILAFATAIHAKAIVARDAQVASLHRKRLLEAISGDIRKCTDYIRPHVSHAASAEARKLGMDLLIMKWQDQPKFDRGRSVFHFEHMVPVKTIREKYLACQSADEVFDVLQLSSCVDIEIGK